jgi:Phosphotransferase enzyme family
VTVDATDADLLPIARQLAADAGRGSPRSLTKLSGGKNNRVFRVDVDAGEPLILKHYFTDSRDPRDRLAAEWGFISYAWTRGVRTIPAPLAIDAAARCGLYSFAPGRLLAPEHIAATHIEQAIDFVLAINKPPRETAALQPGSEACFSIAQHIDAVERRVARLNLLDAAAPLREQAEQYIATQLRPAWNLTKARIEQASRSSGVNLTSEIAISERCISPSDFGFHNAIVDANDHATFIDFEYAGSDDPAKLVCDFFCQPAVPIPLDYFDPFVTRIVAGLGSSNQTAARCHLLLDAFRIKWACIILNDFLPVGAARRAFADTGAWAERCSTQLLLAEQKLSMSKLHHS